MYVERPMHPAGYIQLELSDEVSLISPPLNSVRVIIQPEGHDIRVRDDKVNPTATKGLRVLEDTTLVLDTCGRQLRIISETMTAGNAATAVVDPLTFTAPEAGPLAVTFETVAGDADAITFNNNKFTIVFADGLSDAESLKLSFEAAMIDNPTWPQWTVAVSGAESDLIVADSVVSSGGVSDAGAVVNLTFYSEI